MTHEGTPAELTARAAELVAAGADVVQLADSAGALTPAECTARLAAVADRVEAPFGLHEDANLGFAVANTLAAADPGPTWLDGTLVGVGVGAGAGNTPVELLVAVLDRQGRSSGIDVGALLTAADATAADSASLLLAVHGFYGTLLRQAREMAAATACR